MTRDGRKVMVAYDGSASAARALEHAAGLVPRGTNVSVINVIPSQSVSSRLETVSDAERARQDRLLRDAERVLARRGVKARPVRAAGDPAREILTAAEEIGAGVIVIGRKRRRRVPHIGAPLSDVLVRRASADVLVVH
jgi:nucleotide-binding universal stress UspA family protein